MILVHGRSASGHRRQILLRSHFNRLYLLLLSLLLVHGAIVALMRQLGLNKIHLRPELRGLFELVLAHIHPCFVHLYLHVILMVRVNLLLRVPIVQRLLHTRALIHPIWLAP